MSLDNKEIEAEESLYLVLCHKLKHKTTELRIPAQSRKVDREAWQEMDGNMWSIKLLIDKIFRLREL